MDTLKAIFGVCEETAATELKTLVDSAKDVACLKKVIIS